MRVQGSKEERPGKADDPSGFARPLLFLSLSLFCS